MRNHWDSLGDGRGRGDLCQKRRDSLAAAIDRYLPAGVSYDPPQGGLFLWLRLPEGMRADELLPLACEEGVSFAPGSHFFLDGRGGEGWMRLNFVSQPVEEIEEGMKRMAKALRRMEGGK